eukprot:3672-Heterococcus_DN1.PRE.4
MMLERYILVAKTVAADCIVYAGCLLHLVKFHYARTAWRTNVRAHLHSSVSDICVVLLVDYARKSTCANTRHSYTACCQVAVVS